MGLMRVAAGAIGMGGEEGGEGSSAPRWERTADGVDGDSAGGQAWQGRLWDAALGLGEGDHAVRERRLRASGWRRSTPLPLHGASSRMAA